MSSYTSPRSSKGASQTSGTGRVRVLGVCLALVSMLLAVVGIILHQDIWSLLLAALVALFSLRVFLLWMGSAQRPPARERSWQTETLPPGFSAQQTQNGIRQPLPAPQYAVQQILSNQTTHVPPVYEQSQYAGTSAQPLATPPQAALVSPHPANEQAQAPFMQQQTPQTSGAFPPGYVPIEQDPLFALDLPMSGERCFILPKAGEPMLECLDRYALNGQQRCYAVCEGVEGSFASGPWARILAKSFVEHGGRFHAREDFLQWLETCGRWWLIWMQRRWAPTINALRIHDGYAPGDWSEYISRGAQSTLIGCTLVHSVEPNGQPSTQAHLFVVGDGECLLFRAMSPGSWGLVSAFPFVNPNEFDSHPDTLVSLPHSELREQAWQQHKTASIQVAPDDLLVLATDALARWLLQQIQLNTGLWNRLLALPDASAFEHFLRHSVPHGQIDDDDLTMLIIPVPFMSL